MAKKTSKDRQKKIEDSEDISAESEPEQEEDMDASEMKEAVSEDKASEAEDEATTNSEEDQPAKKDKKKVSESDAADKKKRKRKGDAHHPPTVDMVLDALSYLDNKKGVSIPAIKDYIITQNTVRPETLKHLLRKALVKLLEKESIIRPKGEENKSVLMGRYKIAPKKEVKPEKPRERPASLRKLGGGAKVKKSKKKKRKRSGFY